MIKREIICTYQNYTEMPELDRGALHTRACSNDETTIKAWEKTWTSNMKQNKELLGLGG